MSSLYYESESTLGDVRSQSSVDVKTLPVVKPHGLQLQFLFFYDLKVRIEKVGTSACGDMGFEREDVRRWSVTKHFSDAFPVELIALRFVQHTPDSKEVKLLSNFEWGGLTLGSDDRANSAVECILFKNGILCLLIRIHNVEAIRHPTQLIAHPDYLLLPHESEENQQQDGEPDSKERGRGDHDILAYRDPGAGIQWALQTAQHLEPSIARFVQAQDVNAISFDTGKSDVLELRAWKDWQRLSDGEKKTCTALKVSRPYVGTIMSGGHVEFAPVTSSQDTDQRQNSLKTLAVACARTTPEFVEESSAFRDARRYLEEGAAPRNIYHPGPSIIFIARRGWTCVYQDQRQPALFQDGVVEPTLFAIQAVNASARATRGHLVKILKDGAEKGQKLNVELTRLMGTEKAIGATTLSRIRGLVTALQVGQYRDMEVAILDYAGFLARARLNSPCDDASCLLDAHFGTNSGIAAVARIKALTGLDDLLVSARATMQNYGAFLGTANAHWQARAARIQTVRIVVSLFLAPILYALARSGGVSRTALATLILLLGLAPVMFWTDIRRSRKARWIFGLCYSLLIAAVCAVAWFLPSLFA
jgi:hypothetical protein